MVEETEEIKPSFLEEVKAEREKLETVRDELRELQAVNILSGKADAGSKEPEKPAEKTNRQIAEDALKGII